MSLAIAASPFQFTAIPGVNHAKYVRFNTSPGAQSLTWRLNADIAVKGFVMLTAGGINFGISKNGMVAGGTIPEGTQIDDGIYWMVTSTQFGVYLLPWSVFKNEIVTFSKSQASAPEVIVYYEYVYM
jgi:hypothetical protein